MARAGADRASVEKRQAEGFAAERWLHRTMFPKGQVLNRKGPGDIMLPTGEVIEVKSVPIGDAKFINAGDSAPKHRTIVVVTEGDESEWYVLGQVSASKWVKGRPQWVASSQLCWYATRSMIECVSEWRCSHDTNA